MQKLVLTFSFTRLTCRDCSRRNENFPDVLHVVDESREMSIVRIEGRSASRQRLCQKSCVGSRQDMVLLSLEQEHVVKRDFFRPESPWSGEEEPILRWCISSLPEPLGEGLRKGLPNFTVSEHLFVRFASPPAILEERPLNTRYVRPRKARRDSHYGQCQPGKVRKHPDPGTQIFRRGLAQERACEGRNQSTSSQSIRDLIRAGESERSTTRESLDSKSSYSKLVSRFYHITGPVEEFVSLLWI